MNDLQRLKRECGRGDLDAVEVYPRDCDVVNVANMRHLFVFESCLLPYVWRRRNPDGGRDASQITAGKNEGPDGDVAKSSRPG